MNDEALRLYFNEAASWDADRSAQTIQRMRIAWIVAIGGWICAVGATVALVLLMPLKTVEPYVIRVDNSTGVVDIVPMYAGHADLAETVVRHLLTHYITVCEGFNFTTAERDYKECGAYHGVRRNREWYALWNPSNPNSPLNLYKDGTSVQAQVTAITFFSRSRGVNPLAQVRYLKAKRQPGGADSITHWIATIEYVYASPSRDPRVRQFNPLGFRVIEFRPEAESVPDASMLPSPIAGGTP